MRMQNRLIYCHVLISIVVFQLSARGQLSIGLEAGPDLNFEKTNIANIAVAKYTPLVGLQVGVPIQYKIKPFLAVEAEPSFLQKGYKLEWTGYFSGIYQSNINSYWNLPLMGDFVFNDGKFHFTVQLGGYLSYWSGGRVKGNMPNILNPTPGSSTTDYLSYNTPANYDAGYAFNAERDNRWELGWLAGGRLVYDYHSCQFFAGLRYDQSATDQQKNYMINQTHRYNRTWLLSIGCLLKWKAIKW
jgi:hypothetical protein